MAAKKITAMDFIVAALKKNKKASYADIKAAADKKKLVIYPIMYGRAKAMLGLVKVAKYGSKTKAPKRGPGRPRGSKNKRGPGRPKGSKNRKRRGQARKVASATDALQELVANMKATERENQQLRGVLEKVANLIQDATG